MNLSKVLLLIFTLLISSNISAQDKKTSPFTIGETVEIESEILNEKRRINIYLPYGYSKDSLKTYPVIYLLDGSIDEDFIHISGLVQFASFSWINMISETIVVGIANIDRVKDFTFSTDVKEHNEQFPTSGGSADFIQFIEEELQVYIETNYMVDSVKTLIGQSLGGLLATEILFKNPDLFTNYIIVSPSLWWGDESLYNYTPKSYSSKKSIYIAVGKEGEIMEREAAELYEKLKLLKKDNTALYYQYFEQLSHGDALHLAVYDAFVKIFDEEGEE